MLRGEPHLPVHIAKVITLAERQDYSIGLMAQKRVLYDLFILFQPKHLHHTY